MKTLTQKNDINEKEELSSESSRLDRRSFTSLASKISMRPTRSLVRMKSVKPLNIAPRFAKKKED